MHFVETMAYTGMPPWHGLGNRLGPQQPIEVWKRQAGMNWKIEEAEVRYVAGNQHLGVFHAFPDNKVLYRSDTRMPLSVVSKRFQVVQPGQILEFYRDLTAGSGFELEAAGVLREGRKFWALARTGQSITLKGHDKVDGYLLLATACDGTLATTAQFTSVRVICNNTLSIALGNVTGGQGAAPQPVRSGCGQTTARCHCVVLGCVCGPDEGAGGPPGGSGLGGRAAAPGADLYRPGWKGEGRQRAGHGQCPLTVRGWRARCVDGVKSRYGLGSTQQRDRIR